MNMQINWHEHYKAVRLRIANAGETAPEPAAPKPSVLLLPSNAPKTYATIYPVPVGPFKRRDWLLIASTSKDKEDRKKLPKISARHIIKIVADVCGQREEYLKSPRRDAPSVRARQEAMWLCKKYTLYSLPEIGRFFGGRDHTTVLHAVRKIDSMIAEDGFEPKAEPFVQDYLLYKYKEPTPALASTAAYGR